MLQFWRKDKQKSPHSSPVKIHNGNVQSLVDQEFMTSIGPLSHFTYEQIQSLPCESKSRLSLNLEDVFNNKVALSYFSQFMEAHGYGNILSLLLDVESIPFRISNGIPKQTQSAASSPSKSSMKSVDPYVQKSLNEHSSPKKIFSQYLCDDSPFRVRLPEELRIEVQSAYCSADFDYFSFDNLREYLHQLIKKEVWVDFLHSDCYCKYQIEIMTSGKMTLSDVLYNDACLNSFIEFLEQERCECVIEFWLAATSFERQYSSKKEPVDTTQIQNDAILIYDKYLSLQATSPLGLNDKVRFAVEEGICGETETAPTCLTPAVCLVEAFLRTVYLRLFLSSHQYLSLLSDVMSSSQPRSSSPASSVTDGGVDSSLPCDPDLLWRRRKQNSGLSFGRIDQLGRYETDIEPEPDKKSESRISRVVKLILNKDEHKAQEEMAWRVAEMIVKDITSITMGTSQSDEDL